MSATPQPELPFTRLGEWDVLAPIAEGGMAHVYLGRSTTDKGRFAALKVIRPELCRNKGFVEMFLDEGRIATRLAHPSIATIYEVGHDGARHFLAMELLHGRTLLEVWLALQKSGERLPFEVAAWIGARIAAALHYVHELKAEDGRPLEPVHRDVNPANVFLTYEGEPKLIDFGLAKAHDRISSTAAGVVKGKLAYLSPEQTHGKPADRRADVFALGVLLWEITVDRRLFKVDDDAETVRRVQSADIQDPTTLVQGFPRALADVLARALARDPAARYPTAGALADDLDAFVRGSGRPVDARSVSAIMRRLFPPDAASPWERLVAEPARIRAWDDQAQKMTWMSASIEDVEASTNGAAAPRAEAPAVTLREALDRALEARLAHVDPKEDPIAAARAHLERAVVDEVLGDGARAAEEAEASLRAAETPIAHTTLRRLRHARATPRTALAHLDAEIAACALPGARADLLAERARVREAAGDSREDVRAAWASVLDVVPDHPAALKGLEGALAADDAVRDRLAAHLARVAEVYEAEPKLAAWVHVERAEILDRALGETDAAKAALVRALSLDGGIGPVRDACVLFAVVHRDAAWLVELLAAEAELEPEAARAARLLLDAATAARHRLADTDRAAELLERAAARAPTSRLVDGRVLDDLVELVEEAGRTDDALRVRRVRLASLEGARAQAHELRAIAALEEARGDRAAAIVALERAHGLVAHDVPLVEELDRLLAAESRDARRVALWAQEAARAPAGAPRARMLVRAAQIAEALGDLASAVEHLRAALVAAPGDLEAVDRLTRLLASPPSAPLAAEARARIGVHAHAAEHATDPARRVAHLEAEALLEEELLGEPALAAATYERVLQLEPGRRSAVVALARTAARANDVAKLAAALLAESKATPDVVAADALRVRAADALATAEPERALAIVEEVLARRPDEAAARRLEQRLHEAAGRWAKVDRTLAARIENAKEAEERADLWLARAEVQRTRLRAAADALAAAREAMRAAGDRPEIRDALPPLLAALGDPRAARDAFVELAGLARSPEARARELARAVDLDELVLLDDEHAAGLLARAETEAPDPWLAERRARVDARRARAGATATKPARRDPADLAREAARVEEALAARPRAPDVLRRLERVAREQGSTPLLANALAEQADAFTADAPKLGALWGEAALVEWKLPAGDASPILETILARAPGDRAALDAVVRLDLPKARAGDAAARARVANALAARLAQASDDTSRAIDRLMLALVLEADERRAREALDGYREVLRIDPRSSVAAAGCARLGARLGDADASVTGLAAEAELAPSDKERARILVQAAGQLVAADHPRLGSRAERIERAAEWLERALAADPETMAGVGLLVAARAEQGARDRLLATLRDALSRARATEAVALLGAEVARIACTDPPDRVLAIDALRRVLAVAPGHVPTLRALADLYLAQRAWGEAAEALEALAAHAREPQAKLPALFELADLYGKTLERPDQAERALRAALDADPASVRAIRGLIAQRRAAEGPESAEVVALVARLADAERAPSAKSAALVELADAQVAAGDRAAAERALVEAAALTPSAALLARVLALHPGAPPEQARALEALVARTQELEHVEPSYVAALGQLEIDALGRHAEGVAHLRVAVALAPSQHDARAALAKGLVQTGHGGEALAVLGPMIAPDASPLLSLKDPAGALATLERALALEARHEEAIVARELRAIAGGLDDGAHVELRARRHADDPTLPPPILFDRASLIASVAPREVQSALLEVGAALAGVESKLARTELADLGIGPRDALPPASTHPAALLVQRLSRILGAPLPPVVVSDQVPIPRLAIVDPAPWLLVPASLFERPEPMQTAALARAMTRLELGMPWVDELRAPYVHAVLCGAARQVFPDYALDVADADQQELVEEYARRIRKAIGRKQKKALVAAAAPLAGAHAPTVADVEALLTGIARTELRVAFVLTGDLLAVVDDLRASDAAFATATSAVGRGALAATLAHPVAGDLARFALGGTATALRWRAGTLWGRRA